MEDFFLKLVNLSITAGWLILAVILFRVVFKRVPKWIPCLLWGMVALRLICPFSIESPFSMVPTTEMIQTSTVVDGIRRDYIPSLNSNLTVVKNEVNPMLGETFAYNEWESVAPLQIVTYIASIVWLCGMVLMFLYAILTRLRICHMVGEAIRHEKNIYVCDAVDSPFILGIVRPCIYLSSGLDEEKMKYIIAHEKAHIKRRDHWWKPIGYVLLSVYWFNPLCWIAYILLCRDIELACDEKVVKDMSFYEKKEYSRVLLECGQQKRMVIACPLAFGEVGVKERVRSVLYHKKPAFWILIIAIVVSIVVAVCFLTNRPQAEKEPYVSNDYFNPREAVIVGTILSKDTRENENAVSDTNGFSANDIVLYEQPEPDKVCIRVQPSAYRECLSYYYIPEGEDQEWLKEQINSLDLEGEPFAKRWEGKKETGWEIVYNDMYLRAFEGGYLYYQYTDETDIKECMIEAPKICDYILTMVLLDLNYYNVDVKEITNIVSARLDICNVLTDGDFYTQTITDRETLDKFEDWFSNAEYLYGGAGCGNESACLELTLANGEVIKLSMAVDSCSNFGINGVYYDYRPTEIWDNREFYRCFNEIPWSEAMGF